ncbi:MAG: hypothetical protein EOP88_16345 [Verrucomicrobiaceae bacterium]|nr:MAG: hypothetical protein EOP88_16345 [Verrucomicrobiaceae bacterium]
MRYRPSKRVVWLVVPLLPVAIMCVGVWLAGQPDTAAIANRGSKAPEERRLTGSPSTWGNVFSSTGGLIGDGMDALMMSPANPWRNDGSAARFYHLQFSKDPAEQAEYQRLKKLGREWYERILARYPELAMEPGKEVPAERNGLLKLTELFKRLGNGTTGEMVYVPYPVDLKSPFTKNQPWDEAAASTCVEANRALIDELKTIGRMTESSMAGKDPSDWERGLAGNSTKAAELLMLDARLAAGRGDIAGALESIRAARGLADHLGGGDASMMHGIFSASINSKISSFVFSSILPTIPAGQVDAAAWQAAMNPTVHQPSDFARTLRADWNSGLANHLLPMFSDTSDSSVPRDADLVVEVYTRHVLESAKQAESLGMRDLENNPPPVASADHLSRRGRSYAQMLGMTADSFDMRGIWERQQAGAGLTQAAFAMMNGQPVPNDPVSGKPYQWDPATRKLSMPDIPRYQKTSIKPITVPKM